MKKASTQMKRDVMIISTVTSFCLYFLLSLFSFCSQVALFGYYGERLFWPTVLLWIGHWPSLITRVFPKIIDSHGRVGYDGSGYFDLKVIAVNVAGWLVLGFVIGLVISVVQDRRKA